MLSKYLKEKRLEAGLSQGGVSKALGYASPQFVSNWERGLAFPPPSSIAKLSKILNVDKAELKQMYLDELTAEYRRELEKKF